MAQITSNGVLGGQPTPRKLVHGVYVPTSCFFLENEDLDIKTIGLHAIRLAQAGIIGLAVQGSNGEAVHLDHEERKLVTKTTREALDSNGFHNVSVIVGCGAGSTRETIQLCKDAFDAGGDHAMVLPPQYFASAVGDKELHEYFTTVADHSPIPLIIYNYPAVVGGKDMNSDFLISLSQHPNIAGVKLTCGNMGKLCRIVAAARPDFLVLAGSAENLLQSLVVGSGGTLCGLGNVAPKTVVAGFNAYKDGNLKKAQELQEIIANGDWAAIRGGPVGTKMAVQKFFGYGGHARAPMPKPVDAQVSKWVDGWDEIVEFEKTLP